MCICTYLKDRRISFERLLHAPAPSATRMAQSLHVPGCRVAKGVQVKADGAYVLAILPATHRIELARLAAVLAADTLVLATEEEVGRVFHDCERGALPPFGRLYGLRSIVDASLAGGSEIVLEGNFRHEGLRMRYRDYESLEAPTRARFASAIDPPRRRHAG